MNIRQPNEKVQKVYQLLVDGLQNIIDLVETLPYVFFFKKIEPEEEFIYISPDVKILTGFSPHDHFNDPDVMKSRINPSIDDFYDSIHDLPPNKSSPVLKRLEWTDKNGDKIITTHHIIKLTNGKSTYLVGLVRDITSQESWQKIADQLQDNITMCSYCSNINNGEEWIDMEDLLREGLKREFSHGICGDCRYILLNKSASFDDISSSLDENFKTERMRHTTTKSKMAMVMKRYQTMFEDSPIGMAGQKDGRLVIVNDAFARMLEYDGPEQLIGTEIRDIIAPDYKDEITSRALNRQKGKDEPNEYYTSFLTKTGNVIEGYVKTTFMEFPELGNVTFAYVIHHNDD